MANDAGPTMLTLTAAILLCGAFSFFIVSARYPGAIKRALILYALANVAVAAGALVEFAVKGAAPQLAQSLNPGIAGIGTCLYYLSYRSLQERPYRLRMVASLYLLFLAGMAYAGPVAGNANLRLFALCALDVILFGLAARDVLMNFAGHGRAHLIQGIGLAMLTLVLLAWGIDLLLLPPAPTVTIHYGENESYVLAVNCVAAAFGAVNFLLMCNDEFNTRLLTMIATDPLTGVANRRRLMERGEEEVLRVRRYRYPLTVVMMDLDNFKKLNDTFGHAVGDHALREAAAACVAALRDIDLVSRSGGEEFTFLLPQTGLAEGLEVAERLRQSVAAIEIVSGNAKIGLSASFGVADLADDDASLDPVMARADRALYRAKAEGRNRVSHEAAGPMLAQAAGSPA